MDKSVVHSLKNKKAQEEINNKTLITVIGTILALLALWTLFLIIRRISNASLPK